MPAENATGSSHRRSSNVPGAAASLGDNHGKHQKHARHVVGHPRLGTRNPSFGRNLSKVTNLANKDEDSHSVPRDGSLLSPRPKSLVKRHHSSANIMPKSASHVALRKNNSSGHLVRNSSAKQLSKATRPEYARSNSHPHVKKAKRKQSPAPLSRQHAVHFDVGSEDEAEGMEGVDDGWTEDSVSPTTTRDNTRSNTRRGSMVIHGEPTQHGDNMPKPLTAHGDDGDNGLGEGGIQVKRREETSGQGHATAQRSSYHEAAQHKPLDAEDVAKRLLQKRSQAAAPPLLSDVSISASTEASNPRRVVAHQNGAELGESSSGTPRISRFTDIHGGIDSKDGTPVEAPNLTSSSGGALQSPFQPTIKPARSPTHSHKISADIKRNQSLPSFMTPHSPVPEGGSVSGTTTPGGLGHGGRIQQKMWLQRGLSEMESRSQQNLRGMLTPGGPRTQRLGAQPDQSERIETELKVVRRYRHPVEESMDRLRKLKDSPLLDYSAAAAAASSLTTSPSKKHRQSRDGTRTPGAASVRTVTAGATGSPPTPTAGPGATFSLAAAGDDDGASTLVSFRSLPRDWDKMPVDDVEALRELEEATLDVRRQLWELQMVGDD